MKKLFLLLMLLIGISAKSQIYQPPLILTSSPTGGCPNGRFAIDTTLNVLWFCSSSTWLQATGGGTPGTVTSVTGTANQIAVANGTTTPILSITSPVIFPGLAEAPLGFNAQTTGSYGAEIANNASTGTTLNKLVCDDGAGKAIVCPHATSTTNTPIGIAVGGAGTTGNVITSDLGFISVIFDNQTTALHWAIESTSVDGDLTDTASTSQTAGQPNFFIWTANAGAGTASIVRILTADEFTAGTSNGGGKATAIQVNGTTTKGTFNLNGTTPSAQTGYFNTLKQSSTSGNTTSESDEVRYSLIPQTVANSGALPGTCTIGQLAFVSNATPGQQIYECDSTNHWTQQLDNIGGSGNGGITPFSGLALTTVGSTTQYFPFGGGLTSSTTEANVASLVNVASTIANLAVTVSADPGNGNTLVFTLRNKTDGVDTSLTCTIIGNGTTSKTCSDTAHSFATVVGKQYDVELVPTGTFTAYTPNVEINFTSGTTTATGTVNNCSTQYALANYAATGTTVSCLAGIGTTTQVLHGNNSGNPTFGSVVSGDISNNAIGNSQLAVVQTRRVCTMVVGSDNAAAVIANADLGPQSNRCFIPYAATVVEIDVDADAGTPSVIVRNRHCSTYTTGVCSAWTTSDYLSSALAAATGGFPACSNTGGTTGLDGGTTCSATLQNTTVAIGDWMELKSGTAGGTAKRLTVTVVFTVS